MSRITDYAFLFQKSFKTPVVSPLGSFKLSDLNSSTVQSKLKTAGINTNSMQYKAAVKQMMNQGNGMMYGNIQGIKNLMSQYDSDGDYIDPNSGLSGLLVTKENEKNRRRVISIPDSSKEEMFELTKKEFLRENGVGNGDTTRRTDVYFNLYRKMPKQDRLAAGYTLDKYERMYTGALYAAAKAADPDWEIGKAIKPGALDGVTRESAEAGNSLSGSSIDTTV